MKRIQKKFKELKAAGKKAFIVYITSGDPTMKATERLIKELDRCGVDIVELGVPFSDPMADGPTIQAASERALRNSINIRSILGLARRVRRYTDLPLVLMTYYNPVYSYGIESFVKAAKDSGIDGVIVPDLPPEEGKELLSSSKRHGFSCIFLLSPTSSPERMKLVSKRSDGFIYYVSLTGVTGAREHLPPEIRRDVKRIKRLTKKPVCVGFGISTPAQARAIARASDGVIIGSAVIKIVEKNLKNKEMPKAVGRFVKGLVKAVKAV